MRQPVGKRPCGLKRTFEGPAMLFVGVARQKIVADDFHPRAEVRTLWRFVGPHRRVLRYADQFK
jgi:hypothetical protein